MPVAEKLGNARQHPVGAFRRLDREHALIGHDHGLTDVERTGGVEEREPLGDVGMVALARTLAAERSFRHQDIGRDLVRADQPEAVLLEDLRDARQQMVVAATKDAQDPRQQQQRPDEDDVAAAFAAGEAAKSAELPDRRPVMRKAGDLMRIRPPANGEQHDAAAARAHRLGDRKRQAAAAANDRQRRLAGRAGDSRLAHVAPSARARRTAMVIGREPARMKAITLATSGWSPLAASTASSRSRKVPLPKNMAA